MKQKIKRTYEEDEVWTETATEVVPPAIAKEVTKEEPSRVNEDWKPSVGEIYVDDVQQLYKVLDVFTNSCIVEPVVNKEFFASEIMSFEAMRGENWRLIAKAV